MKKCIYNRSAKNLPSKVLFTGKRWRQYHRLFARQNCNRWQQWKSENVSFLSSNISLFLVHTKIKKNIYLASSRLGKYHHKTPTLWWITVLYILRVLGCRFSALSLFIIFYTFILSFPYLVYQHGLFSRSHRMVHLTHHLTHPWVHLLFAFHQGL